MSVLFGYTLKKMFDWIYKPILNKQIKLNFEFSQHVNSINHFFSVGFKYAKLHSLALEKVIEKFKSLSHG